MSTTLSEPIVTWEKLPSDFPLPDDPVDNINQPLLAAALTESLELAGRIQPSMLIGTNFGICATVDGKLVVKAPDWFYVRSVLPTQPPNQNRRSYTPRLEGEVPAIVMEFLSETEGGEYSINTKVLGSNAIALCSAQVCTSLEKSHSPTQSQAPKSGMRCDRDFPLLQTSTASSL